MISFLYEDLTSLATWEPGTRVLSPATSYVAAVCVSEFANFRWQWRHADGSALTDAEWDEVEAIVAQATLELMTPVTEIDARMFGWDGGAWKKASLPLGYEDVVRISGSSSSLGSGTNSFTHTVQPSNGVWVVTSLVMRYVGTVTNVSLSMTVGGNVVVYLTPVTSGFFHSFNGYWVAKGDENIVVTANGATVNDDFYYWISGFKFTVQ